MKDLLKNNLRGKRIEGFTIHQHSSGLEIEGGYTVNIEGLCRYLGENGVFIVTDDHGHIFGLPAPYDAEAAIKKEIVGQEIADVAIRDNSKDLTIQLSSGALEIICTSMGYETAQLRGPDGLFVVFRHE